MYARELRDRADGFAAEVRRRQIRTVFRQLQQLAASGVATQTSGALERAQATGAGEEASGGRQQIVGGQLEEQRMAEDMEVDIEEDIERQQERQQERQLEQQQDEERQQEEDGEEEEEQEEGEEVPPPLPSPRTAKDVAERCYRRILLHRSLRAWVRLIALQQQKHARLRTAVSHLRSRRMWWGCTVLRSHALDRQLQRKREADAADFRQWYLKFHHFVAWRGEYTAMVDESNKAAAAAWFSCETILITMMKHWKAHTKLQLQKEQRRRGAVRFHYFGLLAKHWRGWLRYLALRDAARERKLLGDDHRHHALLQRGMRRWRAHRDRLAEDVATLARCDRHHCDRRMKRALEEWRGWLLRRTIAAHLLGRSDELYETKLARRAMGGWVKVVELRKRRRRQHDGIVATVRGLLDRMKKERTFAGSMCSVRSVRRRSESVQVACVACVVCVVYIHYTHYTHHGHYTHYAHHAHYAHYAHHAQYTHYAHHILLTTITTLFLRSLGRRAPNMHHRTVPSFACGRPLR
jgi:hypothetical protein